MSYITLDLVSWDIFSRSTLILGANSEGLDQILSQPRCSRPSLLSISIKNCINIKYKICCFSHLVWPWPWADFHKIESARAVIGTYHHTNFNTRAVDLGQSNEWYHKLTTSYHQFKFALYINTFICIWNCTYCSPLAVHLQPIMGLQPSLWESLY